MKLYLLIMFLATIRVSVRNTVWRECSGTSGLWGHILRSYTGSASVHETGNERRSELNIVAGSIKNDTVDLSPFSSKDPDPVYFITSTGYKSCNRPVSVKSIYNDNRRVRDLDLIILLPGTFVRNSGMDRMLKNY